MSFLSQAHSTETLVRGLELARAPDLMIESDPDPAALAAELDRLEDPQLTMGFLPNNTKLFKGNCFMWSLKIPPTWCPQPTTQAIKQDLIARAPTISMEDAGDLDKMTEDDLKILFVSEVGLPRKNNTKSSFGFHIFTTLYILYYIILYYFHEQISRPMIF